MPGRRMLGVVVAAVAVVAGMASCENRFGATVVRQEDPVVLTGAQLPKLVGRLPSRIVAFAWDGDAWQRVPVQVDERDHVQPGLIYNRPESAWAKHPDGTPFEMLVYTPPGGTRAGYRSYGTYTPPDHDPYVDADDEIALLGDDLGQPAPASAGNPGGVNTASRQKVTVRDPRDPKAVGYAYLFASPSLDQAAVTSGVDYHFRLDSGAYRTTYRMGTASNAPNNQLGPNPEHSTVTTDRYETSYADRWLNDGLVIREGSTGADLLDRANWPVPNAGCARNEDTYDLRAMTSPYEAAFVVNISGQVRAIRSHMGANSFTYTVQTDLFYPRRQDTVIELLGHGGLPGYASYDDLTTGLAGMTYSDNSNAELAVDGQDDTFTPISWTIGSGTPPVVWQMVEGPAGSMVTTRDLVTDVTGARVNTYYRDLSPDSSTPCTGDSSSWGRNGFQIFAPTGTTFPNTDPTLGEDPPELTSTRVRYLLGSGATAARAAELADRAHRPMTVTVGS